MDTSAPAHRKIELQSPEDFSYLMGNVRCAAADSINAAFPLAREDDLRVEIEKMVNDYIAQTFTLASANITINGLAVDPASFLDPNSALSSSVSAQPEEQYEPFDGRKRQRVEDLAREEEDLLREIAQLKRRVPAATAGAWAEATKTGLTTDEEALDHAREKVNGAVAGKQMLLGEPRLERQEEVEKAFAGIVEALGRLKRDMPATVAKMERARVAGEYVSTTR